MITFTTHDGIINSSRNLDDQWVPIVHDAIITFSIRLIPSLKRSFGAKIEQSFKSNQNSVLGVQMDGGAK
uniref:Uncharacterized protein n=1 Tax=Megaselia scalaris TaxID=36166 RepID=T1GD05_MEGSC